MRFFFSVVFCNVLFFSKVCFSILFSRFIFKLAQAIAQIVEKKFQSKTQIISPSNQ
jgi:hypothetical protein